MQNSQLVSVPIMHLVISTGHSHFRILTCVCFTVSENSGLTGGQVAGIIIGILGFVFIILVITYVIWKNWKPTLIYKMDTSLGFDNALFHRTNETVSLSE